MIALKSFPSITPGYRVEIKTDRGAKWRVPAFGINTFPTIGEALAAARAMDQDGVYHPRCVRIMSVVTGNRCDGYK